MSPPTPAAANLDALVATFDAGAATYEESRRQLVPAFDGLYGTAVEMAGLALSSPARVLDLGAGTGLLSRILVTAYPQTELVLVDASAAMLREARRSLDALGRRCEERVQDLRSDLPPGPFDAVVSALAIHHLTDVEKQALYRRVFGALRSGGVFVNADQVAGPTGRLEKAYGDVWLRQAAESGASPDTIAAAQSRMAFDRPSPVEAQLAWLRRIGFSDVDSPFRHYRFGVLVGWRPPAGVSDPAGCVGAETERPGGP